MRLKKRRKSSRFRGSQTARRGKKARTRGSGNQGGKGWSGTGKRGDQKKTLVIKLTGGNNYFGEDRALRRGHVAPKLDVINVSEIELREGTLAKEEGYINLKGYKILGNGEVTKALKIKASAASASALEMVKKAGGQIIVPDVKEEKAPKVSESAKSEAKPPTEAKKPKAK